MAEERYYYQDFEEYCTITDTKEYPKSLLDFYNELVKDGYLEDYDYDCDVILELAEESWREYLQDHCLTGKEITDKLNEQDKRIKRLLFSCEVFMGEINELNQKITELEGMYD